MNAFYCLSSVITTFDKRNIENIRQIDDIGGRGAKSVPQHSRPTGWSRPQWFNLIVTCQKVERRNDKKRNNAILFMRYHFERCKRRRRNIIDCDGVTAVTKNRIELLSWVASIRVASHQYFRTTIKSLNRFNDYTILQATQLLRTTINWKLTCSRTTHRRSKWPT